MAVSESDLAEKEMAVVSVFFFINNIKIMNFEVNQR